jgi:enoyl-CoA hydratase
MTDILSPSEFSRIVHSPIRAEDYSVASGCNMLVVDLASADQQLHTPHTPATIIVGLGNSTVAQPACDIIVADDKGLDQIIAAIDTQPTPAFVLTQILRHNEASSIAAGLLAESLAYSTLQHGAGFRNWLNNRTRPQPLIDEDSPLQIERTGDELLLILNRPKVHNAYNADLKDALCAALQMALTDNTIKRVRLSGNGASFSAGGDLSEFGEALDAGVAHVSRTSRSAGALLASLTCHTTSHLHGACIGAGIELPAFTKHISAHPGAIFQLPEVAMGLIPGAGGTVSVLRRIGRQRTALLAISDRRIDAPTALKWGLIDEVISDPIASLKTGTTPGP